MLASLTIRDVVLIDRLELKFHKGLCVLTGETGAGKSILLDSLGLALGARGDASLVRRAPDGTKTQAAVTAEFQLPAGHIASAALEEHGIEPPRPGEPLILKRVLSADGRSRAFINDQPASIGLLRDIGEMLVEIEGQFASRGLLNAATHRDTLDAFAGLATHRAEVAKAWREWRKAADAYEDARAEAKKAREEEEYLRHVTAELEELDPKPGEEEALAQSRALLQHAEQLMEAVNAAMADLTGSEGAEARIAGAHRTLSRQSDKAAGRLDEVLQALDRAADQAAEAVGMIEGAAADFAADPQELEASEERLFALRAAARKHRTDVDGLAALMDSYRVKLASLDEAGDRLSALEEAATAARARYAELAEELSAARRRGAEGLDIAVAKELTPLKLDKTTFYTRIKALDEAHWGETGIDRVTFEVSTNPGAAPGPLDKIASGGELARIMLALKVVLSEANPVSTLVFDEVDAGIGGATAAAVGERLDRLGEEIQVLVVTHSPQVAARGAHHLRVMKGEEAAASGAATTTRVDELSDPDRREEIARMIAGAQITDEARAAAAKLIAGHTA